ncbi:MAG: ComEC/Rec2 family competence protein [Planctomycetes bacterium]|nr:ComEC/Rec2 family competence protein [Planctomycetota bacterium]
MPSTDKPLAKPRRPALLVGAAATAGCTAGALFGQLPWLDTILFVLGSACGVVAILLTRRPMPRTSAASAAISVTFLFAAYSSIGARPAANDIGTVFPDDVELVRVDGEIIEGGDFVKRDPAAFEYPESPRPEPGFPVGADPRQNVSFLLRVEALPDLERDATGILKVYAPPETQVPVNSRVRLIGRLRRPRRAGNPGELDSRDRYAHRGISHTLSIKDAGQIELLSPPAGWDPRRVAPWVHEKFHELIGSRMSRERAAILGATLLGERGNLTPAQRSKFVRSGTVHLLVVSGLHVGLLAAAVLLILRAFGVDPRWAWGAAGSAALVYLFITGVQPSVLRATVMVVVYALGRILLRRPDPLNVLGASAIVSLAINPGDVTELGFQLSYLAVFGILAIAPALRLRRPLTDSERLTRRPWETGRDWLAASFRISLAVGLCTWPLLAYSVHIVSPSMLLTNLIVGPLLTAMLGVALLIPLAVVPVVGEALAWLLSMLAGLLELVAGTFAALPGGHLFLPSPPEWWLIGYYVALALIVIAPRLRLPRMSGAALWLLWLCLLPMLSLAHAEQPGPARMTALDVGQGQCVVFEVSDGPCAVLDCGSTSLGGVGERVLAPYLWSRGRDHIDVLFISHVDADHVNGLPQLFDRFSVGRVYVSEVFDADDTGREMLAWLAERADVQRLKRGDRVTLADRLEIRCLWPDAGFASSVISEQTRRNDSGLVLELLAGERRVLLPSDVESAGLAGVMPLMDQRGVDVLFAPHQGSHVDGLDSLLKRLRPGHVVLSARETFPAEDAIAAYDASGARVWRTWESGAVTFRLGADGSISAESFVPTGR